MFNLFLSLVSFSLVLTAVSAQCETVRTEGGTGRPEQCVFPFSYNGQTYNECITVNDPQGKLWCSVEVDRNGVHVSNRARWGHCNRRKCSDNAGGKSSTCVTNGSGKARRGTPCVFPFKINSETFNECTRKFDNNNELWCSTRVDSEGNHIRGNWGHCDCTGTSTRRPTTRRPTTRRPTTRRPTTRRPTTRRPPSINDRGFLPQFGDKECATKNNVITANVAFVVGGRDASLQEYPFVAAIGFQRSDGIIYGCGGTLINRWYVLSAAHCFQGNSARPVNVRLGEVDFKTDPDCLGFGSDACAPKMQTIDIASVKVHEDFDINRDAIPHDIALLRLSKPAELSDSVSLACFDITPDKIRSEFSSSSMAQYLNNGRGARVDVIGWGRTEAFSSGDLREFGVSETKLQSAGLNVQGINDCRRSLGQPLTEAQHLCARNEIRDSCRGDSGGPLFITGGDSQYLQVGIVSFGPTNCGGGLPGVYTRLETYVDWVKRNLV